MYKQNATAARRTPSNECLLTSLNEERSTLGAALLDRQQAAELLANASIEDFTYEPYRTIFEMMKRLGPPFEVSTIASELERAGLFDRVGWDHLVHLDDGVVTALSMSGRLARLRNLRQLRAVRALLPEINNLLHSPFSKAKDVISESVRRLEEIGR